MGSSAAAIVGGVRWRPLFRVDDPATTGDVATEIEGHPDNVAAAVLGGLTIAWLE